MKRFYNKLIIILTLLCFVIVTLFIGIQTKQASDFLSTIINESMAESGYSLSIEGCSLSLPLNIGIKKLTITQNGKIVAKAEEVIADVKIASLMTMRIIVDDFKVGTITIMDNLIADLAKAEQNHEQSQQQKAIITPHFKFNNINIVKLEYLSNIDNTPIIPPISVSSKLFWHGQENYLNLNLVLSAYKDPNIFFNNLLQEEMLKNLNMAIIGKFDVLKQELHIRKLGITSTGVNVQSNFSYFINSGKINALISYHSPIIGILLSDLVGTSSSDTYGKIKVSGDLNKINVDLNGVSKIDLNQYNKFQFPPIKYNLNALLYPNQNSFTVSYNIFQGLIKAKGEAKSDGNLISAEANIKLMDEAISQGFNNKIKLLYNLNKNSFESLLDINSDDIGVFGQYVPELYAGQINIQGKITGSQGQANSVVLKGNIANFNSENIKCDSLKADLNIIDIVNNNIQNSSISLENIDINSNHFDLFNITANSLSKDKISVAFQLADTENKISFNTNGELSILPPTGYFFKVLGIEGKIGKHNIESLDNGSINFALNKKNFVSNIKSLKIGKGDFDMDLFFDGNLLNVNLKTVGLPAEIFKSQLPISLVDGKVDLLLSAKGRANNPIISSEIIFKDFTTEVADDFEIDNVLMNIMLDSNKLQIIHKISDTKKSLLAELNVKLPVIFSISPFKFEIENAKPVYANLNCLQPVDLFGYFQFDGQKILSKMQGNISLTGSLRHPFITGGLKLSNGMYEYTKLGVQFYNISSLIQGDGKNIFLKNIFFTDPENNPLSGEGKIAFSNKYPFEIKIQGDNFNLLRMHYAQGNVGGFIEVKGDVDAALAKGNLLFGPLEINIPNNFDLNIPQLNIIDNTKLLSQDSKQESQYPIKLDINAKTEGKVFIKGFGVDAALKGNVHLQGTLSNPLAYGSLKSTGGRFEEFGQKLDIDSATLVFSGEIPPSPFIKIVAKKKRKNYEISLMLAGPLLSPVISISSNPAVSEEQAYSLLIYGDEIENISPFQLYQLANSLAKYSKIANPTGGVDPFAIGKKVLKIDEININSKSVGLGKHINDNLYIEFEEDVQSSSPKGKINLQVSPYIGIESIVENKGDSSIGINWQFDY